MSNYTPMQSSTKPYKPWGSHILEFSVYIHPPRDPNNPYQPNDPEGNPADPYYVTDSCKSWYSDGKWHRRIKIGGHGGKIITKALMRTDPYFKSIYDHINATYPLETINPFEA